MLQLVMLSWSWLATIGRGPIARWSSFIWPGFWLETPKCRTLPAAASSSNAPATSSGSISASGRWSSSTSRYSVPSLRRLPSTDSMMCRLLKSNMRGFLTMPHLDWRISFSRTDGLMCAAFAKISSQAPSP